MWPSGLAAGGARRFDEAMSKQSAPDHHRANIVLRGGPFDGRTLLGDPSQSVAVNEGRGPYFIYRPSDQIDPEHRTLAVFVIDHMEPI